MASKVPGSCRTLYESKLEAMLACLAVGATGFEVVALIGGTRPAPTRSGTEPGIGSAPEGRGATVVAASAWRIAEVLRDQPDERSGSSLRSQGERGGVAWAPDQPAPASLRRPPEPPRPPR